MFKIYTFTCSFDAHTKTGESYLLSQGTVATFYKWVGYIYNHLMWRFFGIPYTRNYQNQFNFLWVIFISTKWTEWTGEISCDAFFPSVCAHPVSISKTDSTRDSNPRPLHCAHRPWRINPTWWPLCYSERGIMSFTSP